MRFPALRKCSKMGSLDMSRDQNWISQSVFQVETQANFFYWIASLVLLEASPAEHEAELGEGEGDGDLGVGAGLGRHVVEALGEVDVLCFCCCCCYSVVSRDFFTEEIEVSMLGPTLNVKLSQRNAENTVANFQSWYKVQVHWKPYINKVAICDPSITSTIYSRGGFKIKIATP